MKIVLTGTTHCGKTSLVNKLKEHGYKTIEESARNIISQYQEQGKNIPPENPKQFQMDIINEQKRLEDNIDYQGPIFLDRGMPDIIVFSEHFNIKLPKEYYEKAINQNYNSVFVLEQIPSYKKDKERFHSEKESKEIENMVYEKWRELGYEIKTVPVLTLEKRMEYVVGKNETFKYENKPTN